jgi:hypothetical protein
MGRTKSILFHSERRAVEIPLRPSAYLTYYRVAAQQWAQLNPEIKLFRTLR